MIFFSTRQYIQKNTLPMISVSFSEIHCTQRHNLQNARAEAPWSFILFSYNLSKIFEIFLTANSIFMTNYHVNCLTMKSTSTNLH